MLSKPPTCGKEQRRHRRFLPLGCGLSLKQTGFIGAFAPNLSRGLMNLSEGGVAAVVTKRLAIGETLKAHIILGPYQEGFDLLLKVRRIEPCQNTPGCFIVGCEFEGVPPVLRVLIRSTLYKTMAQAGVVRRGALVPRFASAG